MEHLIKPYSCIPGEKIFLKKIFPNFLFCFHHLSQTAQQCFLPVFPVMYKTNRINFLLVFFCHTTNKKYNLK